MCRRGRRQAARGRSGLDVGADQELVVRRLRKWCPSPPIELPRVLVERRLEVVDRPALGRESSTKEPENSVWFSTSIVNMPAVGDVSPSYVQPSLVSVARIAASSPPQAMGTRDTAAVSSATAMRVLDATRRAYRRGPASRNPNRTTVSSTRQLPIMLPTPATIASWKTKTPPKRGFRRWAVLGSNQ